MPRIYGRLILVGLMAALVAGSGIVYAHFANSPKVVESTAANDQPKATPSSKVLPTTSTTSQSGPCTKTVTKNSSNVNGTATNNTKTDINCSEQTQNGSSLVNITNDSSQSATTGNSTGTSGTASNNDSTDVNVSN